MHLNYAPVSPETQPCIGLLHRLARDRQGNAAMIVAAATVPLLALIGGSVDMGRGYLTESRLQQACDAGVLAARKRLGSTIVGGGGVPVSVAAAGNKFFNINFRAGTYGTQNRNFVMTLEPDYSVSGVASVEVPTTIMKLFGFSEFALTANCEAKINFSNTDIMMVLDTTGSMEAKAVATDPNSKLVTMKNVIRSFHNQMESSKGPGIRVRYGFVPYSTNVNVGALLKNEWVVDNWHYQTRELSHVGLGPVTTLTTYENWVTTKGVWPPTTLFKTYPATSLAAMTEAEEDSFSCDKPNPTATPPFQHNDTPDGPVISTPWVGPPAGVKTVQHFKKRINGDEYWTVRNNATCEVYVRSFDDYRQEFDKVTVPHQYTETFYNYAKLPKVVSNWRTETNSCVEERDTYEINDYTNVDFTRALDLDIRMVPTGDDKTKWRPMYPGIIYLRDLDSVGNGTFSFDPIISTRESMYKSEWIDNMVTCPSPSRKLEEMPLTSGANTDLDTYINAITAAGTTYHDIGMIWGGRLTTPFGLFAAENADVSAAKPTRRHLIFLTDGQTEAYDIAYGAYGNDPLDRRRWNKDTPALGLTLNQVVEKRFSVACEKVKADNITVWVIGFGTTVTQLMKDCAGPNKWFQADNAASLNTAFTQIAGSMGDLRISK